jgi:dihydrofolate reductase
MTSNDPNMPPTPRELTLIVAATNKMGIGLGGTLPWTGLKKEMAYFARVTKRASPGVRSITPSIPELS